MEIVDELQQQNTNNNVQVDQQQEQSEDNDEEQQDNKMETSISDETTNKDDSIIKTIHNRFNVMERIADKLEEILKQNLLSEDDLNEALLTRIRDYKEKPVIDKLETFMKLDFNTITNKTEALIKLLNELKPNQLYKGNKQAIKQKPGPDELILKEILERTGYAHEVSVGQRKYGGPPPNWGEQSMPGAGCEVFVGKLPKDVYEDILIPLFEQYGQIWDLRVMIEPSNGNNKGYAFVTFCDKESAKKAADRLNGYEIRPGKHIKCNVSIANVRLYVGNIPKTKSKEELKDEFSKVVEGLTDVIIYQSTEENNDKLKNRGFCFLDFDTHKNASQSRRKLMQTRFKVFNREIAVDWAEQTEEPDEETMSKVKTLYVRNLASEINEEEVRKRFEMFGEVDHVSRMKDYAFVEFKERESALKAMEELNGKPIGKFHVEITLARPLTERKAKPQQKREENSNFKKRKKDNKNKKNNLKKQGGLGGGNRQRNNLMNRNRGGMIGGMNHGANPLMNNNQNNSGFNEQFFAAMGSFMKGFGVPNPQAMAMQFAAAAAASAAPFSGPLPGTNMMMPMMATGTGGSTAPGNSNMNMNNRRNNRQTNINPNMNRMNSNMVNFNPRPNIMAGGSSGAGINNNMMGANNQNRPNKQNKKNNYAQNTGVGHVGRTFGGFNTDGGNNFSQANKRKLDNNNINRNKKGRFAQNPNIFGPTTSGFQISHNPSIIQQPLHCQRQQHDGTQWYQDDFTASNF